MPHDKTQQMLATAVKAMGGQEREGQVRMAEEVSSAIENREHLLVQAGTGTGKSLGYLVPVLAHLKEQENPVVVATATLALQNQIVNRDLPELIKDLKDALDHEPEVIVAKGRANYLCKLKYNGGFADVEEEPTLFDDPAEKAEKENVPSSKLGKEVKRVMDWADKTTSGERDELVPGVSDQAWQQFSVTARECVGSKCPVFEQCFVEVARNDAKDADIIVTNHAFLAAGTFDDAQILPEWDVCVIDEAHELVDRVTGAMSSELSVAGVASAAKGIRRYAQDKTNEKFEAAVDAFNDYLHDVDAGLQIRVPQELHDILNLLMTSCGAALRESQKEGSTDPKRQQARARVQEVRGVCETVVEGSVNGARLVVWFTKKDDSHEPATLHCAPLEVGEVLQQQLFENKAVIATSATLVLGDSFAFLAKALGFQTPDEFTALDVGSPFDYAKQGILYVAKDLPEPKRGVSEEALQELKTLIEASEGGALCLFSSRGAAEYAADWMREEIEYEVFCQGDDSTPKLVQDFADDHHACLFGTLSLWQGVDVPGSSCRLVAIDRIPFPRPDDPLVKARSNAANESGGNGFMDVSATIAATRLAQGSGRLIRTVEDKGVVAILDSRMESKRYGSFMRKAMPNFWYTTDQAKVLGSLSRLAE